MLEQDARLVVLSPRGQRVRKVQDEVLEPALPLLKISPLTSPAGSHRGVELPRDGLDLLGGLAVGRDTIDEIHVRLPLHCRCVGTLEESLNCGGRSRLRRARFVGGPSYGHQIMTTPTSYDVRAELESLLERDLLGPRDGQHEELPPGMPPAERYLVGRLVPRTRPSEPPAELAEGDTEVDDPSLIDQEVTDGAAEPDETGQTGPAVCTARWRRGRSACPSGCRCRWSG